MPQERRRKAPDLPVPARDDDAAERKRVLNVLAQRRYRKRKREHLQELESKLQGVVSPNISPGSGKRQSTAGAKKQSQIPNDSRSLQCLTAAQGPPEDGNARQPGAEYFSDSQDSSYRIIEG